MFDGIRVHTERMCIFWIAIQTEVVTESRSENIERVNEKIPASVANEGDFISPDSGYFSKIGMEG